MRLYETALDVADQLDNFMEYVRVNGLNVSEVQDTLDSIQGELAEKAEKIVKSVRNYEKAAELKKNEAAYLIDKAALDTKKAENLKSFLDMAMKVSGVVDLNTGLFTLKYKKGSKITQIDEDKLPKAYWVTIPAVPASEKPMAKPDLKKLIDSGTKIPGVEIIQKPDVLVIK